MCRVLCSLFPSICVFLYHVGCVILTRLVEDNVKQKKKKKRQPKPCPTLSSNRQRNVTIHESSTACNTWPGISCTIHSSKAIKYMPRNPSCKPLLLSCHFSSPLLLHRLLSYLVASLCADARTWLCMCTCACTQSRIQPGTCSRSGTDKCRPRSATQ